VVRAVSVSVSVAEYWSIREMSRYTDRVRYCDLDLMHTCTSPLLLFLFLLLVLKLWVTPASWGNGDADLGLGEVWLTVGPGVRVYLCKTVALP